MIIDALANILDKSHCLDEFWGALGSGSDATLAVASSARPFLVAARFAQHPQCTLVVVSGEEASIAFARNVAAYIGEEKVLRFPERRDYPFQPKQPDMRVIALRMQAAHALRAGKHVVVVASARSLVRAMPPACAQADSPIYLESGKELADMKVPGMNDLDTFVAALEARGYSNTGELDGPATFARRGGTVDIFPANSVFPVRVDFFGDEVDEIRRIVPSTGQTIASLSSVEIYPASEFPTTPKALARAKRTLDKPALTNKALREVLEKLEGGLRFDGADILLPYLYDTTTTLGDYVNDNALVCLMEPRSVMDDAANAFSDAQGRAKGSGFSVSGLYVEPSALDFGPGQHAVYVSIMRVGAAPDDELPVKRTDVAGTPDKLFGKLLSWTQADYTCVFSATNYRVREDMKLAFVDRGLAICDLSNQDATSDAADVAPQKLRRGIVNVVDTDIPLGMVIPKAKLALVSIADTQGAQSASRKRRNVDITKITFPYAPGDYVVHAVFGVALFKAIVRREIDGTERDYMELEYAEGDKLFLPVEQLDRVTKYVGAEGSSPRLTRLNTSDWSRAVSKARKATKKLAFDLVDVYSRRAATKGYQFVCESPAIREMEESFPYDETPDQCAAIADVKADMASLRPMDRLICGDVGFGKTEVALRAAFICVESGKQVMLLCPTTILAQQHYTSFNERLQPFGVNVAVLSRFKTDIEQTKILEEFSSGTCQILIGTHRLLSRDVNPKDLGLVIIDEEQRFGVGHKEQLKNLRETIDVLTLSATPIPRTMQMAVSGVRDMSLILTPPNERMPVKVHVGEWDPDIVSDAIRFELSRGGQLYYVSNRVRTIEDAVQRVSQAAPEARVGVAHGQMSKEQLERVMEEFSAGKIDVLVATTIIESGIDNPHTNTLIIEDSQRLGLAQMYQLKGRVGRSNVQAYSYFMFPEEIPLTEEAEARLIALDEHQELGSGMRIAMRDLEIRGAGSMLGAEQSGNMSAVGFDLFAQMLNQAVAATREGDGAIADSLPAALSDITVNVPGHSYLPEEYIPDTDERVLWYRKLASASTQEMVNSYQEEILRVHADMPAAARNLFAKARCKAIAAEHGVKTVSLAGGKLTVEPINISASKLTKMRRRGARYLKDKRKLTIPARNFTAEDGEALIGAVSIFLDELYNDEADREK
ncbi:transcription-repair coupling factor [Adlercreutzia sp. ZJ154]|uniref:transcription-repair coupling factor n=1 Tax=Adlercreutzia sp. ZJ154 TaxID=2709790 RepID=UPI0013EC6D1B|nr:transcription-repair coupling factor [Adlercreutzia sp. ZJ154]